MTTVALEMPSRVESLDLAAEFVAEVAEAAGLDEDSRLDVQLAIHESLVNAIVHGNRCEAARRVTLQIDLGRYGLEIRVRDEGQGFDPTGVPDPLAPENLSKSSGRGILLMKALMDSVTFCQPESGGTEITMRKLLALESAIGHSAGLAGAEGC